MNWTEEVFNSMKGSRRANPRHELLDSINERITREAQSAVPLSQISYAAVAAIIVILLNSVVMTWYGKRVQPSNKDSISVETIHNRLINSYDIY